MPRLAVLGHPVAHSRSPAMQNAALAELGLAPEWSYQAIDVRPEEFARLVASLPADGFAGVNVTVPHKVAALAAADVATDAARAVGAANTLTFREARPEAANTDTVGILDSLPRPPAGMRALVLGAGGSARAAVWALREGEAEVTVWNRTAAKAVTLAREFSVHSSQEGSSEIRELRTENFDLILNATTVGLDRANAPTGGQPLHENGFDDLKTLRLEADALHAHQVVVDLVYGANETQLIAAARAAGAACVDGLEVLVRQGAASLALWTGAEPPLETMRRAVREVS
jgi:shikimate dehydrogenase